MENAPVCSLYVDKLKLYHVLCCFVFHKRETKNETKRPSQTKGGEKKYFYFILLLKNGKYRESVVTFFMASQPGQLYQDGGTKGKKRKGGINETGHGIIDYKIIKNET